MNFTESFIATVFALLIVIKTGNICSSLVSISFSTTNFEGLTKQCSSGWVTYDNLCYQTMKNNTNLVPWGLAQERCMKMDRRAHLPIYRDRRIWKAAVKAIPYVLLILAIQLCDVSRYALYFISNCCV